MRSAILLVFLLESFQPANLCLDALVANNYSAFETLMLTDGNLDKIASALFPDNLHRSVTANVSYQFLWPDELTRESWTNETVLYFQWSSSPVHLFINPFILKGLSLNAYSVEEHTAELFVSTSCNSTEIISELNEVKHVLKLNCTLSYSVVDLLNRFTINLQSYALHKTTVKSNGIPSTEKGYSVYYINPHIWSQYCVLNYENTIYKPQRYVLNVATLVFVIVAVIASPLLFTALYGSILKEARKSNSSKFLIWSAGFTSIVASAAIIVNDVLMIIQIFQLQLYTVHTHQLIDIYAFFITFTVLLPLLLPVNCFTFMHPMSYILHSNLEKKLEVPQCWNSLADKLNCCCWFTHHLLCRECVALLISHVGCSYFFELLAFHIIYVVLGAIVTPVETLSTIFFYMALYVCLVVFGAITLKAWDTKYYNDKWFNGICCYVPLMVLILLFLACFVGFLYYFHIYITMVQTYSTSQGIWHIIGSILPTAIVTSLSIGGKYFLDKMKSTTSTRDVSTQYGENINEESDGNIAVVATGDVASPAIDIEDWASREGRETRSVDRQVNNMSGAHGVGDPLQSAGLMPNRLDSTGKATSDQYNVTDSLKAESDGNNFTDSPTIRFAPLKKSKRKVFQKDEEEQPLLFSQTDEA